MSSYDRMMEDYDYHQNTGELPEYFEDGKGRKKRNKKKDDGEPNDGCLTPMGILAAIIIFVVFIIVQCS